MDFFLWGYLKAKVYDTNPVTLDELKDRIRSEIQNISTNTCKAVIENFRSRLQQCKDNEGLHMDDVIFKK